MINTRSNVIALLFAVGTFFAPTNTKANIEIELKFKIHEGEEKTVQKFLADNTTLKEEEEEIKDAYYDTSEKSLGAQKWRLRVRNNTTITMKNSSASATARREFEHELPLTTEAKPAPFAEFTAINDAIGLTTVPLETETDIATYLSTNKLLLTCFVNKRRTTYQMSSFNVMYDDVDHLGAFVEIEAVVPDGTEPDHIKAIENAMRALFEGLPVTEEKAKYEALMIAFMQKVDGK